MSESYEYNTKTTFLSTTSVYFRCFQVNTLSANPKKWSNTFKQFVGKLPMNYLSVFGHFVGLALKGLTHFTDAAGKLVPMLRFILPLKVFQWFWAFLYSFQQNSTRHWNREEQWTWTVLKRSRSNLFAAKFFRVFLMNFEHRFFFCFFLQGLCFFQKLDTLPNWHKKLRYQGSIHWHHSSVFNVDFERLRWVFLRKQLTALLPLK